MEHEPTHYPESRGPITQFVKAKPAFFFSGALSQWLGGLGLTAKSFVVGGFFCQVALMSPSAGDRNRLGAGNLVGGGRPAGCSASGAAPDQGRHIGSHRLNSVCAVSRATCSHM